jgi:hypothetical protein
MRLARRTASTTSPIIVGAVAIVLVAITLLYRIPTLGGPLGGFEDDQFVHLSEARQVLLGDAVGADFVDVGGMPLTIWLSAAAQRYGGPTLWSEVVLTTGALALCTLLLFFTSLRATGSVGVSVTIALLQVILSPRNYNYPKLLAYGLAIPVMWWYLDRPSRVRLALVAAVGTLALLLRYDHGVYIGAAAIIAVALAHRSQPALAFRRVVLLAVMAVVLVSPYLAYLASHGVLVRDLRNFYDFSRWATTRTDLKAEERAFHIDRTLPLVVVEPAPVRRATVHVRWKLEDVEDDQRVGNERALGLTPLERLSDDTWLYELQRQRAEDLAAIVAHPSVVDTSGIDRGTYRINDPDFTREPGTIEQALSRVRRVHLLPGYLRADNAVPFLFWLLVSIPLVTLLLAGCAWAEWLELPRPWREGATKILVVAALGLLMTPGLLRGNLVSRFADVTQVAGVSAAWAAACLLGRERWLAKTVTGTLLLVVTLLAVLSIDAVENVRGQLQQTQVTGGPGAVLSRVREVRAQLSAVPPFAARPADEPGAPAVARYLNACTAPTDRVLVLSYAPEIAVMANRGFAGGISYVRPELFDGAEDQALMVERLEAQRVPIVLTEPDPIYSDDYVPSFSIVTGYLRDAYQPLATVDFGREEHYRVLTRRGVTPRSTYEPLHLPCFAPGRPARR